MNKLRVLNDYLTRLCLVVGCVVILLGHVTGASKIIDLSQFIFCADSNYVCEKSIPSNFYLAHFVRRKLSPTTAIAMCFFMLLMELLETWFVTKSNAVAFN